MDLTHLEQDTLIKTTLKGNDFHFFTTWGLFSPKEIDHGTELLVDAIPVKPQDTILDLGCGYGALGISLAKIASQGETHLVDKDFVAVEYARKNAKINKVYNTKTYLSNGFSQVPDMQFDLIVSNLPAKVGKELYWIFFTEAKEHLKTGGKIYIVTLSGLKEYMKRTFQEIFGNFEKVEQSKNYIVISATKKE